MKNHTTIKQRLALLAIAPFVSLALLAGILITESYTEYRGARKTQSMLKLAVASGNIIHALQIERGATTGFIQTKGAKFADVLPGIRQKTDTEKNAFTQEAERLDQTMLSSLGGMLKSAQEQLAVVPQLRERTGKFDIAFPSTSLPTQKPSLASSS